MNPNSAPFENVSNTKFFRVIAIVVAVAIVAIAAVIVGPKLLAGGTATKNAAGKVIEKAQDNASGPFVGMMKNDPAYNGGPITTINNPDRKFIMERGMSNFGDYKLQSVRYDDKNWYFNADASGFFLVVYDQKVDGVNNPQKSYTYVNIFPNSPGPITAWNEEPK